MKEIIFIKLGGSLITDKNKPFTAKIEAINNLANQIAEVLKKNKKISLIIGNGGGSFPHYPAVKYKLKNGIKNEDQKLGFCEVQDAASRLNRIVVRALLNLKVKAVSINPSSMIICRNGEIKAFFTPSIINFLNLGLTPVIYGDIVYDEILGSTILSTERLLSYLCFNFIKKKLPVKKIIHNGSTIGVLDNKGNLITQITKKNWSTVQKYFYKTEGYDVTGGMYHKIKEALKLTRLGVKTLIINGFKDRNILKKAILGEKVTGTVIT